MTLLELKEKCEQSLNSPYADSKVSLLIPGHAGRGNSKRFPGTGILGEIVCEYENECLCAFDAGKILKIVTEALNETAPVVRRAEE